MKIAFQQRERFNRALRLAHTYVGLLLFSFVAIKVALLFTEDAIELRPVEWLLIWPVATYQHVVAAIIILGIYLGLFWLADANKYIRAVVFIFVSLTQLVFPFLHITALKVEHVLGSFPTSQMAEADTGGSIFSAALFDPVNFPYTLPGLALSLLAMLIPPVLVKRLDFRMSGRRIKLEAIVIVVWLVLGVFGGRLISSYISVAESDPVIYYLTNLMAPTDARHFYRQLQGRTEYRSSEPVFGDREVVHTQKLFRQRDKWWKTKKNIVLVVLESLHARQASFMSDVRVDKKWRDTMPTIRALMKNGLRLENHYTVHPTSMNSLFAINCSLYPVPFGGLITKTNPKIPCQSISEVLTAKGYKSAIFHSGKFSFWKKTRFFQNRGYSLMLDSESMPGQNKAKKTDWGIDEFVTVKQIVKFIKKNKHHPFFVQYIPVFPHYPYELIDDKYAIFGKKEKLDKYHNCLAYTDSAVKKIVDAVGKLGLADDTLFIFVGDHGEAFHEHRGNRVHSIFAYEENIHVAAAMVNPLLFPIGSATRKVTSHIDILPTIADLVGIEPSPVWKGHSLLRDGPSPPVYFYASWGKKLAGMRDGKFKVIMDINTKDFEIYDLLKDPKEKKNLADKYKKRLEKYEDTLDKWREYFVAEIPALRR